jgi:hypothetical protein
MLDLTPILEAIIALAASAITLFLIPWLKKRFGNEKLENIRGWVEIAVYAAEKLYGAGNGDQKLEYAEAFLAQHKIKLDTAELIAMVNAEIKKMEQMEIPILEPVVSADSAVLADQGEELNE